MTEKKQRATGVTKGLQSFDVIQRRIDTLETDVGSLRGELRDGFEKLTAVISKIGDEKRSEVQKELDTYKAKRPSPWAVPAAIASTVSVLSFLGGGFMWAVSVRTAPLEVAIAGNTSRIEKAAKDQYELASTIALDRQKASEIASRLEDVRRWQNDEMFNRRPGERDARFEEQLKLLNERIQRVSDRSDRIDVRIERLQGGSHMPRSTTVN